MSAPLPGHPCACQHCLLQPNGKQEWWPVLECRLQFERNISHPLELQLVSSWDVQNLRCLPVVAVDSAEGTPALKDLLLDSAFYSYQFCQCLPGLRISNADPYIVQGLWRIQCVPEKDRNVTTVVVFSVLGTAVAAAIAAVVALVIVRNRHSLGPPGQHARCRTCHAWHVIPVPAAIHCVLSWFMAHCEGNGGMLSCEPSTSRSETGPCLSSCCMAPALATAEGHHSVALLSCVSRMCAPLPTGSASGNELALDCWPGVQGKGSP